MWHAGNFTKLLSCLKWPNHKSIWATGEEGSTNLLCWLFLFTLSHMYCMYKEFIPLKLGWSSGEEGEGQDVKKCQSKASEQWKASRYVNEAKTLLLYLFVNTLGVFIKATLRFWKNTMIQKAPGHTVCSCSQYSFKWRQILFLFFFFLPFIQVRAKISFYYPRTMISFFVVLKIIGYLSN